MIIGTEGNLQQAQAVAEHPQWSGSASGTILSGSVGALSWFKNTMNDDSEQPNLSHFNMIKHTPIC